MRLLAPLTVALVAACTAGSGPATKAQPTGSTVGACDRVVRVGEPITGDQMLDGCRSSDGSRIAIDHYPCRGTGNVVALLERDGRAWSGEVALAWEEQPSRGRSYGTWQGGDRHAADPDFDAAGCLVSPPDLVEPAPSPS